MNKILFKKGITIVEILVVVIIVGIVASLGIFNYSGVKEDALKREAFANLKLIRAAERIYYLEQGDYYEGTSISDINSYLRLALPNKTSLDWGYTTDSDGCAEADRTTNSVFWHLTIDNEDDPVNTECP